MKDALQKELFTRYEEKWKSILKYLLWENRQEGE